MDTFIQLLYVLFIFIVPMLLAMFPLLALIGLTRLRVVERSALLIALSTIGTTLSGFLSSGLAIVICAGALAKSMQGEGPKCVIGATVFLPVGGFFMIITLIIGIYLTVSRAFHSENTY